VLRSDAGGGRRRSQLEVSFTNFKPVPVVFEYRHRADHDGFRLVSSSRRAGRKGADPLWSVRVPAGASAVLSYRVEYEE
jgi:hypothetical protein